MSVVSPRPPVTSRLRPQYQRFAGSFCVSWCFQVFGFWSVRVVLPSLFWVSILSTKRYNSQRAQRSLLVSLRASRTLAPAVTKTPSLPPARIGKALPIVLFSFLIRFQSAFIVSLCICRLSACLTHSHIPSRTKLITAGAFPRSAYQ